ncbi:hypothetical protein BGZ54_003408 [Gamsiella multidivaricata]|nr:hypothetical protein BGZ54_003408 [Gamsiella multidivaricata]
MSTASASAHESRQAIDDLTAIADNLEHAPQPNPTIRGKLDGLIRILQSYRNEANGFCAIVLVEREVIARVLCEFLAQFGQEFGLDFVRSSLLAGRRIKRVDVGRRREQAAREKQAIKGFHRGDRNLLVTSEANEEFAMDAIHFGLVVRLELRDEDLYAYIKSSSLAQDQVRDVVVLSSCRDASHLVLVTPSAIRPRAPAAPKITPAATSAVGNIVFKFVISLNFFVRDLTLG